MKHQTLAVEAFKQKQGRMALYADVGIGKTFICVQAALGVEAGKILILCPALIKKQWAGEIMRYMDKDQAQVVEGNTASRIHQYNLKRFTIANYDLLNCENDLRAMAAAQYDMIILDESQSCNNPTSKRVKHLKMLTPRYRLAASGTIWPNALWECYSVIDWLMPGLLGRNFWSFRQEYCYTHPTFHGIIGLRNEKELLNRIRPLIHRITAEDANLKLPPKTDRKIWVEMDENERKQYEQLKNELRIEVEGMEKLTVPNLLALIIRLRQLTDCPSIFDLKYESAKEKELEKLLPTITGKVLIFTEFVPLCIKLWKRYGGLCITGSTPTGERSTILEEFKTGQERFLFGTSALRNGANIQSAKTVIHFSLPFHDAALIQRLGRIYRHGQTQEVEEIYLLTNNSIDERIWQIILRKRKIEGKFNRNELISLLK